MEMMDAGRICLKEKFATFKGRASRAEYWLFYAFIWFAVMVISVLAAVLALVSQTLSYGIWILVGVGLLVLIIPGLAVSVRRLHDINKSGWFILISFIPFVGAVILLYWLILGGDKEANRFGEVPAE